MTSAFLTRRTALQAVLFTTAAAPLGLGRSPHAQEAKRMRIRIAFNGQTMTAVLGDNPSARDFASMLPLHDLTIDNYANNEKIGYRPRKLTEEGSGPFGNERPGDLCYYAPWGNLAFFYAGYRWSRGLIRLGRIDDGHGHFTRRNAPLRQLIRYSTLPASSAYRAQVRQFRGRPPYTFLPPIPVLPRTALIGPLDTLKDPHAA